MYERNLPSKIRMFAESRGRLGAGLIVGVLAGLPLMAVAFPEPLYTFSAGQTIEAEPFNEMFAELYAHAVPSGAIVMWAGTIDTVPAGWVLCDGTDGAPDLRDRFIVGAGGEYVVGEVGGEAEVVLKVDQMPAHTHQYHYEWVSEAPAWTAWWPSGWAVLNHGASDPQTGSTGGDQPHENRPPYFALAYIMKT